MYMCVLLGSHSIVAILTVGCTMVYCFIKAEVKVLATAYGLLFQNHKLNITVIVICMLKIN